MSRGTFTAPEKLAERRLKVSNKVFDQYAIRRPHFRSGTDYPSFLERAVGRSGGMFLDVGAGDGSRLFDLKLRNMLDHFETVAATDISAKRISNLSRDLPDVKAFVADGCSLPVDDGAVSFYFSDQVIEHVPDDLAFLLEARRVISPKGLMFVGSVLKNKGAWYFYRCNGEWRLDPTHVREYSSADELLSKCRLAGFEVLEHEALPVRFPVSDYVLRIGVALGLISAESAVNVYSEYSLMSRMRYIKIRIPRYDFVYVLASKS
jgi:ubiquinone/menaquinone biosynthesis C-methylase UbiE